MGDGISDSEFDELTTIETVRTSLITRIARTIRRDHRGTMSAKFETEAGYFLCETWFEDGVAQFQFRSNAWPISAEEGPYKTAVIVAQSIHMAVDWSIQEAEKMREAQASS